MKDLRNLRYFLGMKVTRNKTGISVSQIKCVIDLLKETGVLMCEPIDTPMDPNVKLSELHVEVWWIKEDTNVRWES